MKLKVYKDGSRYITGGQTSIEPLDVLPIEEYDLSFLTKEEINLLYKDKKDKVLLKKARKIK